MYQNRCQHVSWNLRWWHYLKVYWKGSVLIKMMKKWKIKARGTTHEVRNETRSCWDMAWGRQSVLTQDYQEKPNIPPPPSDSYSTTATSRGRRKRKTKETFYRYKKYFFKVLNHIPVSEINGELTRRILISCSKSLVKYMIEERNSNSQLMIWSSLS